MERKISIPVGIIAVRCGPAGQCQDRGWRIASIFLGTTQLRPGTSLVDAGDRTQVFVGHSDLVLHATEASSYRSNLEQTSPLVYIVLQVLDSAPQDALPLVHLVTAAPEEAECYFESDPDRVDAVAMPGELVDLLEAFVAEHEVRNAPQRRSGARSG
jgi:Protein of unknown function (DUF3305)